MSYTYYYTNTFNINPPVGSRAQATTYNGTVCPMSLQFGRVHGTSPATGQVTFKGYVLLPALSPVILQIGQSVFYGMIVKGNSDQSASQGANTSFTMVDMRDRLHDFLVFGQFNMIGSDGSWWHKYDEDKPVFPLDPVDDSKKKYINFLDPLALQKLNTLTGPQNIATSCPELFSAYQLLELLVLHYHNAPLITAFGYKDLSFTWSNQTIEDYLKFSKPLNLDFDRGVKLVDAIQQILEQIGLQFTVWGDINIHITRRGFPESQFETQLMAGQIDLCSFGSYVDASIGSELTELGLGWYVLGGPNTYENWFMCFPDWNLNWKWELANNVNGAELSAFMIHNNLTPASKLKDCPAEYQDASLYNGIPRNEMTIEEYTKEILFKVYRVDMALPGKYAGAFTIIPDPGNLKTNQLEDENGIPVGIPTYLSQPNNVFPDDVHIADSIYPIASRLVSDSDRQFLVVANSFPVSMRGMEVKEFLEAAKYLYINGANLEVEEYLATDQMSDLSLEQHCSKRYRVRVVFSEARYEANPQLITDADNQVRCDTNIDYDRFIFVKLATEREVYARYFGQSEQFVNPTLFDYRIDMQATPRLRQTVLDEPNIHKGFIDFVEQPILTQNLAQHGFTNTVTADIVAFTAYVNAATNQAITTAGHIKFRSAAGFMPSGIIETVNVSFSANSGTRETINFSDVKYAKQNPTYFDADFRRRIKTEDEIKLEDELKKAIKVINQYKLYSEAQNDKFNNLIRSQAFGGLNNAANVAVDATEVDPQVGIIDSEVIIVGSV